MIDWGCGDTDANIIAGTDDALINAEAQESGGPQGTGLPPLVLGAELPRLGGLCRLHRQPGPRGYAAAFRHIHDLFAAAGASNVAFVFSIGDSGSDQDLDRLLPGFGLRRLDRCRRVREDRGTPATGFRRAIRRLVLGLRRLRQAADDLRDGYLRRRVNPSYLQQVEGQLAPGGEFPLVKAVMYFDAPGNDGRLRTRWTRRA